jgi:hypothetical protein
MYSFFKENRSERRDFSRAHSKILDVKRIDRISSRVFY